MSINEIRTNVVEILTKNRTNTIITMLILLLCVEFGKDVSLSTVSFILFLALMLILALIGTGEDTKAEAKLIDSGN